MHVGWIHWNSGHLILFVRRVTCFTNSYFNFHQILSGTTGRLRHSKKQGMGEISGEVTPKLVFSITKLQDQNHYGAHQGDSGMNLTKE